MLHNGLHWKCVLSTKLSYYHAKFELKNCKISAVIDILLRSVGCDSYLEMD